MATYELFSKRQKELRGETPDVYVYEEFPGNLKIQIYHIIRDAIGETCHESNLIYQEISDILVREYGVFKLNGSDDISDQVLQFFLQEKDVEKSIDVLELCFLAINIVIKNDHDYNYLANTRIKPSEAVEDLNKRLKESGFGYQFEANEIIRVDSSYMHSEIVKPTISLLYNSKFEGPCEEYLKAHEHYKSGKNKECIAECNKAFESTMKTICQVKNWAYNKKDNAKQLIKVCQANELIPSYMQTQFTSLTSLLESGVPTLRNNNGGHGQGQTLSKVDDNLARYALNLTGSNIIFLVEQSGIK